MKKLLVATVMLGLYALQMHVAFGEGGNHEPAGLHDRQPGEKDWHAISEIPGMLVSGVFHALFGGAEGSQGGTSSGGNNAESWGGTGEKV